MPLHADAGDIALRILLTVLSGAVIGFDRGYRGHAASLRTTILVGLAAAIAMVLTNILLPTTGKEQASFATIDVMRLPLGILTGVGFIGGGTILRRGDLVTGVTTAATLWFMTVVGLCFGCGQILLGLGGTALGFATLWALRWVEIRLPREQRARLVIAYDRCQCEAGSVADLIAPFGYQTRIRRRKLREGSNFVELSFDIRWWRADIDSKPWELLRLVEDEYKVLSLETTSEERH
jgi:putative Mg2+ transporter-C (MgtC) family protein